MHFQVYCPIIPTVDRCQPIWWFRKLSPSPFPRRMDKPTLMMEKGSTHKSTIRPFWYWTKGFILSPVPRGQQKICSFTCTPMQCTTGSTLFHHPHAYDAKAQEVQDQSKELVRPSISRPDPPVTGTLESTIEESLLVLQPLEDAFAGSWRQSRRLYHTTLPHVHHRSCRQWKTNVITNIFLQIHYPWPL
jgi:hypothetical protein